ncbi:MAG TPA: hypothetical protein VGQ30_04140, partial [Gemmatimonadaceae bacterium]|nr:hypothetical protein [Gemmatimonadaceae bacterium]
MNTPRPGLGWTMAATATVLSAALWLRAPATGTLIVCALTTAVSIAITLAGDRAWNRVAFAVAATLFVAVVASAERARSNLTTYPRIARTAV